MRNESCVLLMTACISPPRSTIETHGVQRSDPAVRVADYKKALEYWLSYEDDRIKGIVFVENSGYPLDALRALAAAFNTQKRSVEFLECHAIPLPEGLHYGYSELEMMDCAFASSALISQSDYVIKVTGRLYFPQLRRLLNQLPEGIRFAADSRDFKLGRFEKHYVLTTLFVVRTEFYNQVLLDAKSRMTPSENGLIELLYFSLLKPMALSEPSRVALRFPVNVEPVGVGAHWNKDYLSWRNRLQAFVRGLCRRFLPALRI